MGVVQGLASSRMDFSAALFRLGWTLLEGRDYAAGFHCRIPRTHSAIVQQALRCCGAVFLSVLGVSTLVKIIGLLPSVLPSAHT